MACAAAGDGAAPVGAADRPQRLLYSDGLQYSRATRRGARLAQPCSDWSLDRSALE